jgi:translation initiation factor 2 beta subunit (eIF-2beta)/eIF-5
MTPRKRGGGKKSIFYADNIIMINLFFFLKFKSQLRRTRPDIVHQIDESLVRSISDAGGKITGDRFVISAVFNEDKIGFWLDIYILVDSLIKNIEKSKELFGFSLVISGKPPDSPELLCRFLAGINGVFVDDKAAKRLIPYALFEKPSDWLKGIKKRKYGCGSYFKVNKLKVFKLTTAYDLELQTSVTEVFEKGKGKNILLICPYYFQMRKGLYEYNKNINKNFPPLTICFETIGIGSLVDIWSSNIRSLVEGQATEEIENLWETLVRERIRDEVSEYLARCVRRYLFLIINLYIDIAAKKKRTPVLMLENVHNAEDNTFKLLTDSLAEVNSQNKDNLLIMGTSEDSISKEKLNRWEEVFDTCKNIDGVNVDRIHFPKLSIDLWEIIYAMSLFNRYFSPELFQRLFEEEGKNPIMIAKAFSILDNMGVIDNVHEPRLMNRYFEDHAANILNEKTKKIKEIVCVRLLDWCIKRNLNPCFRLLMIIADLEGTKYIDDLLLLKSFSSDIVNNTISAIETAMKNGKFEEMVTAKAEAIRHIYRTSKALITGDEKNIETVFNENKLEDLSTLCEPFPVLRAQILVNYSGYYLGLHDEKIAAEKAKEAILLGQSKNSFCIPQGYRLFSLVCLSKQQINETIEYLNFALSNAEKNGNYHELAVSAYYAAAAQFLYGDVYHAADLASKSIKQSLVAGRPDWADRSRFLEGRIEFDLGHYDKAHDIFERLLKEPYGGMTCEKENLMAAWIYRSKIYLEQTNVKKPEPANNDADLFEIEAAYLAGDYQKAVDLSSSHKNQFTEDYLYTEQADWRSGFAQCEHLYFTHGEIQSRMISIFHSLALSKLSNDNCEDALREIQLILRDEKLCEMDPWDAFYFYAKYSILSQTEASQVDMSTAVSMAFKRLQRRAGRIDDIETRRQYLSGSRWNKELSKAAKEFKLI